MRLNNYLRSSTFRLALIYMALFGGSVLLLLSYIYWSTARQMAEQADATIETEITGLAERYRTDGLEGLSDSIKNSPMVNSTRIITRPATSEVLNGPI